MAPTDPKFIKERIVTFRPSAECQRQLEELGHAWKESRSVAIARAVQIAYSVYKNYGRFTEETKKGVRS